MSKLSKKEAYNKIQKMEDEAASLEKKWEALLSKADDIDEAIERLRDEYNLHD